MVGRSTTAASHSGLGIFQTSLVSTGTVLIGGKQMLRLLSAVADPFAAIKCITYIFKRR